MSTAFLSQYGPWALVTGASSGIGEEFARQLAAKGLNLVLVARRADRMQALAEQLSQQYPIETRVISLDLTDPNFLSTLTPQVEDIEIGLLVNNAGMMLNGPIHKVDLRRHQQLLALNCEAPLMLAHYYGKAMRARKQGGIIFTSSVSAFMSVPYMSHYAASKAYVLSLAESMSYEMRDANVAVQALCPGYTETEMTAGIKGNIKMMTPTEVVKESLDNLGSKFTVINGANNRRQVWMIDRKSVV